MSPRDDGPAAFDDYLVARADRGDLATCLVAGAVVTLLTMVVLEVFLIVVTLAVSDYRTGTPGPAGGLGYGLLTAVAVAIGAAAGSAVAARAARARAASRGQTRAVALLAPGALLAGLGFIAILTTSLQPLAIVFGLVATAGGSWLGQSRGDAS